MARNPYHDVLDDTFRGERVQVTADGDTYEGWVRMWHFNQPAVVLYGATCDGREVGSVMIDAPKTVERVDEQTAIEEIPIESIEPSPYSARSFDSPDFQRFVRTVRDRGHLSTFPTVRPTDDGFEIVSGHKRLEAARQAGFESVPVRVADLTDWEATVRFVDEHVPLTDDEERDGSDPHHGWYDPDDVADALERLRADWDESRLRQLPAIERHIRKERAASEADADDGRREEGAGDSEEDATSDRETTHERPGPVVDLETGLRTEFLHDPAVGIDRCELATDDASTDGGGDDRDDAVSLVLAYDGTLETDRTHDHDDERVTELFRRTISIARAVGISRPIVGTIRDVDRTHRFRLEPSWLDAYPTQLSTGELLERVEATARVTDEKSPE